MSTISYNELLARKKGFQNDVMTESRLDDFCGILKNQYNLHTGKTYILSDYDCDGICSALILNKVFKDAEVIISDRLKDGYGIPDDITFKQGDLVIVADMGSSESARISEITEQTGIMPFVIDHHIPSSAMEHYPHMLNYYNGDFENIPEYCSAGLCLAIAEKMECISMSNQIYAMLATIGDVCPVNNSYDDNRGIILRGFESITDITTSGDTINVDKPLAYLLYKQGVLDLPHITTENMQFNVIPVINAMSRIVENGGQKAFDILSDKSDNYINGINEMLKTNEKRKTIKDEIISSDKYKEFILSDRNSVKVYVDESIPKGIIGIIASEIVKQTGCPAIVMTKDSNGQYCGSARSINGATFSMLDFCKSDLLSRIGGHDNAFGISIDKDNIPNYIENLGLIKPEEITSYVGDREYLDMEGMTIEKYLALEPFGCDYPQPSVLMEGQIENAKVLKGKYISGEIDGLRVFGAKPDFNINENVSVEGRLSLNMYKGRQGVSECLQVSIDTIEKQKEKDAIEDEMGR